MSYIYQIPRSVPKDMLPGLKCGDLIALKDNDYSQAKDFSTKSLKRDTVGRVSKIFDFDLHIDKKTGKKRYARSNAFKHRRFLVDVRIQGHPMVNFYTEELNRVRI
jgi:hypothetical protein